MNDLFNGEGVPIGFGMALAQNARALDRFCKLSDSERKTVVEEARSLRSKQEMREYVDGISNRSFM